MGCVIGSLSMMCRGTRLVIPAPTFDAGMGLAAIREQNANIWIGTPTMFIDMLDHPNRSSIKITDSGFRGFMSGSMCPEPEFKNKIPTESWILMIFRIFGQILV